MTINKHINIKSIKTEYELFLLKADRDTNNFMRNNPDLIFTRADKGKRHGCDGSGFLQ